MATNYTNIIQAVGNTAWAILPEKLEAIMALLSMRAAGGMVSAEEVAAIKAARRSDETRRQGAVGVLPLLGVISQRMDLMTEASGGTSTDTFAKDFNLLLSSDDISAIVIDIDSPGGSVYGVSELADRIAAARGTKPIYAVANSMAASAAYWIGSQADELIVTPGGEVGSIGVVATHIDMSAANEQAGFNYTLVSAGKYKTEGNPYEALSNEGRDELRRRVEDYYTMFVAAVARGRGVPKADVRRSFGEGRLVGAKDAVALGMADKIATLDDVIAKAVKARKPKGRAVALEQRRLVLRS